MARFGPLTKDSTTIQLGLAQIRIAAYASYITAQYPILTSANSMGAMAVTRFVSNAEYFNLESGFPLMEDASFPLRESAMIECTFREMTPQNVAIAKGLDPTSYSNAHAGSINLGSLTNPAFLRAEFYYVYPDGSNRMVIILPRAQATSAIELESGAEEPAGIAISISGKRADSDVTDTDNPGNVAWDEKPLGRIMWDDGTGTTWTTTSTTTTST